MLFIATVEAQQGDQVVWLLPLRARFGVNTRPRPPRGARVAIVLHGLTAPTREAIAAWTRAHAPMGELPPAHVRPAALADLVDAVNAEAHLDFARAASTDELAAFALDRGGALLAELRGAIAAGDLASLPALAVRAARLAAILGVAAAGDALADIAAQHPIEQLMALEHAVVSWVRAATEPAPDALAALAAELPDDRAALAAELPDDRAARDAPSAGASRAWFHWWWRLAHRVPRADLRIAVTAAVELARRDCAGVPIARGAVDAAERALDRMRIADAARLWAEPPDHARALPPPRDEDDAHYCAYTAVTHAAHAMAAMLRAGGDGGDGGENRRAMQQIASHAIGSLRHRG